MKNQTALVTGCTSGIGLYLAREFAKNRHDLVLVAPVRHELEIVANELKAAYGIRTLIIPVDLKEETCARQIRDALEDSGVAVDILVNNAGQGFRGKFQEGSLEKDVSMVDLNIMAVLRLTKLLLPGMISRGSGKILNTASVAGFEPGPTMAVYHASKAFVLSFSEALSVELENTGVTVTILCPGATDTDFFPKADMENAFAFQKGNLMAPQEVAKVAYKGLMNDELIVIPGAANKMMVAARRILPEKPQAKINKKQYETVPPDERKRSRGDKENDAND